ncbi:MAG: hypothetical protein DRQ52_03285 [Gammaproteobacteria bacterium]|nr:MAG: hypothetical protein DRQ52_03285 [Gammaproteobacteria bacterium]
MAIEKIEHCAIRTTELAATRDFYTEILGLMVGPRPELPVAGYWLYAGDQPIIHLIEVNETYNHDLSGTLLENQQTPGYRDGLDHIAFRATGLTELLARLRAARLEFGENIIAEMDFHQVFVADPNGVMAELNFLISAEK